MKRLTSAGSLIISQHRYRTRLDPEGRPFATNFYLFTVRPSVFNVAGEFTLKNGVHYYYHYNGEVNFPYGLGVVNSLTHVGPSVQPPWLGGKLFNLFWRPTTKSKSTTPP